MNLNFLSFIKMLLFLTLMTILRQYVYLTRSLTTEISERWSGSNSWIADICHNKMQYEMKIKMV